MLCTKEDKSLLLNEIQILGLDYIDELDANFTVSMKNKKATGCDVIPAEAWKILVNKAEEKRLRWSRGSVLPLSSRVQTQPKPSGFFRAKKSSARRMFYMSQICGM